MNIDLWGNVIVENKEEHDTTTTSSSVSPFVYLNNISKKQYPDNLDNYSPYITNLAFSQRRDLVFFANEMNKYPHLNKKMHFDFYFHSLPKKNLFSKWAKPDKSDITKMIKEYFKVSYKIAKQYEKILDEKQLKQIKEWYDKRLGGK